LNNRSWSDGDLELLKADYQKWTGPLIDFAEGWASAHGRTTNAVRQRLGEKNFKAVRPSPYPSYDKPLEMQGDALILTDTEFPFHHADFINHCLQLASSWGIRQLILGGDVLHFESLSGWEPSWSADGHDESLGETIHDQLFDFAQTLRSNQQGQLMAILGEAKVAEPGKNVSDELKSAKAELRRLEQNFDHIDMILGNHEGRLLRAMDSILSTQTLMDLMGVKEGDPKWRCSPYYFSFLNSNGERFQIEHPKNAARHSSEKLAAKFQCSIIQGHSHHFTFQFDPSGRHYAIEAGACVDERLLPYASQRHNTAYAHSLGACIVRGGYPYILHEKTPWEEFEKMA
jgi:hypothetical protein